MKVMGSVPVIIINLHFMGILKFIIAIPVTIFLSVFLIYAMFFDFINEGNKKIADWCLTLITYLSE